MNNITDRLLDSEEHAGDAAVPQVAYDAAEEIAALKLEIRRLTALVTAPPKQYQD